MANVRIQQLPEDLAPVDTDVVAVDAALGGTTRRVPIPNLADLIRPVASQAEAEAGSNNTKTMTPLRTKQSVVANGKDADLTGLASWITSPPTIIVSAREKVSLAQETTIDRTGNIDCSASVIAALTYLKNRGGGKLTIPWGTFLIGNSIQPGALGDVEIEIESEADGKIVAATGMASPVLDLRASSSVRTKARYILTNLNIDCSAGSSPLSGGDFCTALAVQYAEHVEVNNPFLYGGEDPDNINADAGFTTVGCGSVIMNGGRIRGFNDAAIYPNADNSGAVTDVVRIIGTHISRCMNAAAVKRDLALFVMDDCVVEECTAGVVASEIITPSYVAPPRRVEVVNTDFFKVTANAIRLKGPTEGRISGCTIQDFGYSNFDGTGSVGGNAIAIRLQGSSGVLVTDNEIGLKYWTRDQQIGVYADNVTLDGVPYTVAKNRFADNYYKGLATAINEASSVGASTYLNEVFDDVTTPIGGSFGSSGSLITYTEAGSNRQLVRTGNSIVPLTRGLMTTSTSNATLTAADSGGTYRNDGATARVDYTLPAAAEGLEYSFIVSDADGIRVQAVGDDVIYLGNSASTAAGYAQSTVAISTLTLRAINSTTWVATAQTGTWTVA